MEQRRFELILLRRHSIHMCRCGLPVSRRIDVGSTHQHECIEALHEFGRTVTVKRLGCNHHGLCTCSQQRMQVALPSERHFIPRDFARRSRPSRNCDQRCHDSHAMRMRNCGGSPLRTGTTQPDVLGECRRKVASSAYRYTFKREPRCHVSYLITNATYNLVRSDARLHVCGLDS